MKIALNGIKIVAYHGWYEEEALLGNDFEVDICVTTVNLKEDSDKLGDTLNYEVLLQVVKEEMAERSALLEHVIFRIKSNLIGAYPHAVQGLYLSIKKLNPPLPGLIGSAQISIEEDYTKQCAKCGQSMNCFNSEDCWCKSVNLSDVTRKDLQRQYTGCLCSQCLTTYSEHPILEINQ